jgi:cobalamin synthase
VKGEQLTSPTTDNRPRWWQPFLLAGRFLFFSPVSPAYSSARPVGAGDEKIGDEARASWMVAGKWLPGWGLLIGVVYALVFGICWRIFGQYQGIRWLPAVAVLCIDLAGLGYRLLAGTATLAARCDRDRPVPVAGVLAVVLVALVKFCLLVSLPRGIWQASAGGHAPGWEPLLDPLKPLAPTPIYRPLLLMPLWGRYAMELALVVGRAAPHTSRRLMHMGEGTSVGRVILHWLVCTVLTASYCSGAGRYLAHTVIMSLGVLLLVYAACFVMAHRLNGQDEATVGAAGLTGELSFLVLYIALANAIYWY